MDYQPHSETVIRLCNPDEQNEDVEVYEGFTDKIQDQDAQHDMVAWINGFLLPNIANDFADGDPLSEEVMTYGSDEGRYGAVASPLASNGLLFIGAWERATGVQDR